MHALGRAIIHFFLGLGLFGPLLLGILDSSFLFLPTGNDILVFGLVARNHDKLPLYVPMAAFGSVLGVLLVDLTTRKNGEQGLRKRVGEKRFDYLKEKMSRNAVMTLSVACVAPPPFPFTPVIAAASAFQYPRTRLLTTVFVARLVRFSLMGMAAIVWGRPFLRVLRSETFFWIMSVFILICIAVSAVTILGWTRRESRNAAAQPAQ